MPSKQSTKNPLNVVVFKATSKTFFPQTSVGKTKERMSNPV